MCFQVANECKIHNVDTLRRLVEDRSRPLITISNHRCRIDDPLMWGVCADICLFSSIVRFRYY